MCKYESESQRNAYNILWNPYSDTVSVPNIAASECNERFETFLLL